jgi:hypothetical protein
VTIQSSTEGSLETEGSTIETSSSSGLISVSTTQASAQQSTSSTEEG